MKNKLESILPDLLEWIKKEMKACGGKKAILGISGGKDSTVTAGVLAKALGAKNVLGVILPNGNQYDLEYALGICDELKIKKSIIDIKTINDLFIKELKENENFLYNKISEDTKINLPARIRMTFLYAISQSIDGGRVINTSNLSEDFIGYTTVHGNTVGAFAPLGDLTSTEVVELGYLLNISEKYLIKIPEDGLTGLTDEEKLGFSYEVLDKYIRTGEIKDLVIKEKIDKMHKFSRFKFEPIPLFDTKFPIKAKV